MKPLIVIAGPTASGKTGVAVALAGIIRAEIISADSRQVYRGLDIGTAKPSLDERNRVDHHMLDLISPDEGFSAGEYKRRVDDLLTVLENRSACRAIILTGGTGLYLKAVLYGLWNGPRADPEVREALRLREEASPGCLHALLSEADPGSATRIHPNDLPKIIRAIEVFLVTGKPLSHFHEEHRKNGSSRPVLFIGLKADRRLLNERIDLRVDAMIAGGWVEEVKNLLARGYHEKHPGMKSLGYGTLCACAEGKISLPEAVSRIKQETRQYAKRQLTWFNADPNIEWMNPLDPEFMENLLKRVGEFEASLNPRLAAH